MIGLKKRLFTELGSRKAEVGRGKAEFGSGKWKK